MTTTADAQDQDTAGDQPDQHTSAKRKRPIWFRIVRGVFLAYALILITKPLHLADYAFYFPSAADEMPAPSYLDAHEVRIEASDGVSLHGWFLRADVEEPEQAPTVIHFHGNAYNIQRHLEFVDWLPDEGFNVLTFDYRGYGLSQGSPDRDGVARDAQAALAWAQAQDFIDSNQLLVFAQSLGGAVAMDALGALDPIPVRAAALDATFPNYRRMANAKVAGTFLTQPLAWALVSKGHDPDTHFAHLRSRPFFVMHGDADLLVPYRFGVELANALDADLLTVEDAAHVEALESDEAREALLRFYRRCLRSSQR